MSAAQNETRPFRLSFCSALEDGSLFVAGIALELEDRDVAHTILWERIDGSWQRLQWKNRTYGMIAFARAGDRTAVYMGYEGTIKLRSSLNGSTTEVVDGGPDGPSSLRTISTIRHFGDHLYVCGMRRMVYRRGIDSASWSPIDTGLRQGVRDTALAGLYGFDGSAAHNLVAAGIGGEVWHFDGNAWSAISSPTNLTLLAVRHISDERYVLGGELGGIWVLDAKRWIEIEHAHRNESFTCIDRWQGRCFLSTESGMAFELVLADKFEIRPFVVPEIERVSWMTSTAQRLWVVGENKIMSLGEDGWTDESPAAHLLTP